MNECQSCHTPLSTGAASCPRCGAAASRTAEGSNADPFMDFGPFMERASQPPTPSVYQSSVVGASQQAQPVSQAWLQIPLQQSSQYPQEPYAVAFSLQMAPVIPVPPQTRSRRNSMLIITLVAVLVVCIITGSGIIYYAAVAQPTALHAQATAAANTYATAQTRASATASANTPQGIFTLATSGNPTINDSLSNPDTSLWANHSHPTAQCAFTDGAYRVTIKATNYMYYCTPLSSDFSNMALQVQMTIVAGNSGGIMFRASRGTIGTNGYLFLLFNDRVYALFRKTNGQFTTLAEKRSSAMPKHGICPDYLLKQTKKHI